MIGGTVSHYRIIEELGAGGMGQVFKAEDLKLRRTVALKFVSENLARDDQARKRFEREARAASSLNHPHICTIHQIDEFEGKPFIVMELLEGQPLSTMIREAPLKPDELIELAIQIADALHAAHEKGIIHRDLKPSNIFISHRRTAKILDFGLAKLTPKPWSPISGDVATESVLTLEQSFSQPGLPMGTLGYMPPEQIRGEPTDARGDLFSFGITMYEMATGQAPFRGSSAAVILGAILHQVPVAPSVHNPALPRELDRIIAKALEKDKNARYQTASDMHRDLVDLKSRLESGRQSRPRRLWFWAIPAAILLCTCLMLFVPRLRLSSPHSLAPAQNTVHSRRRSLAVLGFRNLTGRREIDWLSVALSEMLSTELATGEALRIIPGENVTLAAVGFSPGHAESYNETMLDRLRKRLGTDLVVVGSYVDLGPESGNQLRVDVRLEDAARGETLSAVSQTGAEANLFQLVTRVGSMLREKLGIGNVPASEIAGVRASLPSQPEIMRLYAEGLTSLRGFDFLAARDLLNKVVLAQPDYAPAHSALSRAYSALGFDEKATGEAKRAYDLSVSMPREDQLAIEARYREATHNWEAAIDIYRSLWRSFPDNLEYGLQLAHAQTSGGKARDALETVKVLHALPSPSRDDPRIDLTEVAAFQSLGEFDQSLRSVQRVIDREGESSLILARAYAQQGWSLYRTGRSQQALAALKRAQKMFSDSGQKQGSASVIQTTGDIFYNSGDFNAARKLHEQALAIYRQIGDQSGIAGALNDIANSLYTNGNLSGAKPLYQESLEIYRVVGATRGIAGALGNLANVLDGEGDLDGAAKMQEQSLAAFRQIGDQRGASTTLANIGNLLLEKGELVGARKAQEEGLAQSRKINYQSGIAYSLQGLGEVLVAQGDLADARRNFEQTMAMRRDLGEQNALASTWVDLADLSISEGKMQVGEQLARAAVLEFNKQKDLENEAVASTFLTRALLGQGKLSEAQNTNHRARSIIPRNATHPSRFLVGVASARVQAMAGASREARQEVQTVIETARRFGYLGYEFEARLALGEIEIKAGERTAAAVILNELERDAALKGFSLIVRKVQALR
ncbi:MAG TPA: protein kinase [Bryobacteraceae bacterium]|nr:protein kinase [Bryobacteraceae bacterium]